ncbi:MAG TPA: hypothetical protein VMT70_01055 [Vicinamibacteria bacterium]|nr:hypothetical protein [Vicinamibacteria bacterium]
MGPGRAKQRLVVRRVGAETIVYDPATHAAHCLGPLAAAVWRMWDARASAAEMSRRLEAELDEPVDVLAVEVAARRLARAGLVERREPTPGEGGGGQPPTRREALREILALTGLAVASLVVPTPSAAAATCKPNWQIGDGGASRCQSGSECCSKCCSNYVDVCLNAPGLGGCH